MNFNKVYFSNLLSEKYPKFAKKLFNILDRNKVKYTLIDGTKDIWMRDYMPLIREDGKYIRYIHEPDYLKGYDNIRTNPIAVTQFLNQNKIIDLPLNLDGGNLIYQYKKLICTDKIYRENPSFSKEQINDLLYTTLQLKDLIIIPDIPDDMTGHADGMVRFITDTKVLVAPMLEEDKDIEKEMIKKLKDKNLKVLKISQEAIHNNKDEGWAPQINFLKTTSLLVVPIVKNIPANVKKIFENEFSDYSIEYLDCGEIIKDGGALNCISWNKS